MGLGKRFSERSIPEMTPGEISKRRKGDSGLEFVRNQYQPFNEEQFLNKIKDIIERRDEAESNKKIALVVNSLKDSIKELMEHTTDRLTEFNKSYIQSNISRGEMSENMSVYS